MTKETADFGTKTNQARTSALDWACLASFGWFAAYADQYIYSIGGPTPLYWQMAAIGALAIIVGGRLTAGNSGLGPQSSRILIVLTFYCAWVLLAYLYSSKSEIADKLCISRLKVAAFIFLTCAALERPSTSRPLALVCAGVAILGSCLNLVDFFTPTFSVVHGRAAGFYGNPNSAGFMLVCLGVIANRSLSLPLRYLFWALLSIGVFLTFSRAAWLYLFLAVIYLTWIGELGLQRARTILAILFFASVSLIVSLLLSGELYRLVSDTTIGAYLDPNTIGRLGGDYEFLADDSATERQRVLELGLQYFWDAPLLGHGLASTFEWDERASTHNMYVLMLAEGGLVGLAIYLVLLYSITDKHSQLSRLLILLVFCSGFATHNLLDMFGEGAVLAATASGFAFYRSREPRHH